MRSSGGIDRGVCPRCRPLPRSGRPNFCFYPPLVRPPGSIGSQLGTLNPLWNWPQKFLGIPTLAGQAGEARASRRKPLGQSLHWNATILPRTAGPRPQAAGRRNNTCARIPPFRPAIVGISHAPVWAVESASNPPKSSRNPPKSSPNRGLHGSLGPRCCLAFALHLPCVCLAFALLLPCFCGARPLKRGASVGLSKGAQALASQKGAQALAPGPQTLAIAHPTVNVGPLRQCFRTPSIGSLRAPAPPARARTGPFSRVSCPFFPGLFPFPRVSMP